MQTGGGAARPIVNRFERRYGTTNTAGASTASDSGAAPGAAPVTLPPRTIGSKIPINRRHKRRR
jgi:hypothetical protein